MCVCVCIHVAAALIRKSIEGKREKEFAREEHSLRDYDDDERRVVVNESDYSSRM